MHVENAKWLRGYLLGLDPATFDYAKCVMWRDEFCGCVAFHVVKAKGLQTLGLVPNQAHSVDLEVFLQVNERAANKLFTARMNGDTAAPYARLKGANGIARAVAVLDEIAADYGVNLTDAPVVTTEPSSTDRERAFIARIKADLTAELVAQS